VVSVISCQLPPSSAAPSSHVTDSDSESDHDSDDNLTGAPCAVPGGVASLVCAVPSSHGAGVGRDSDDNLTGASGAVPGGVASLVCAVQPPPAVEVVRALTARQAAVASSKTVTVATVTAAPAASSSSTAGHKRRRSRSAARPRSASRSQIPSPPAASTPQADAHHTGPEASSHTTPNELLDPDTGEDSESVP
jgi:hypothetical protein